VVSVSRCRAPTILGAITLAQPVGGEMADETVVDDHRSMYDPRSGRHIVRRSPRAAPPGDAIGNVAGRDCTRTPAASRAATRFRSTGSGETAPADEHEMNRAGRGRRAQPRGGKPEAREAAGER